MKYLFFIVFSILATCVTSAQRVIAFRTTFFGDDYPYIELHISNDNVFLEEYKNNFIENTHEFFKLSNRQRFIDTDSFAFELLWDYLNTISEEIDQIQYPKPFEEIYYIHLFNMEPRSSKIVKKTGENSIDSLELFNELLSFINQNNLDKKLSDQIKEIIDELKTNID